MRHFLPLFAFTACLAGILPAQAGEFKSPKGFSLTYPERWQVASAEQLKKTAEESKKLGRKTADYAARISAPRREEFTPFIGVTVNSGNLVPAAKDEKDFAAAFQRHFESGGRLPDIKTDHLTVGGQRAFTMALERTEPTSKKVIRQWIVMLPGKQQTYTITCTALKSQWSDVSKGFRETVLSFKNDLPTEFKSPRGFSLTCPSGWHVASEAQVKQMAVAAKKLGKTAPDYAVMVLGPRSNDSTPIVYVTVVPEKLGPDEKDERDFVAGMKHRIGDAGKSPDVKTGHLTIDGKKVFTVAFEMTEPTSGKAMRSWMLMVPGKQQAYMITCMALKSEWGDAWPKFNELVRSFQIDLGEEDGKKGESDQGL